MNINEAFPSSYLKAEDLQGKSVTVTIEAVELVSLGQGQDKEQKILITFRGKEKGLVANKTNANTISKLYGPETDDWIGQTIIIKPMEVEFKGDLVWAIRVSLQKPGSKPGAVPAKPAPAPRQKPTPAAVVPEVVEPEPEEEAGGEVPF
jgi:hypothetical protein